MQFNIFRVISTIVTLILASQAHAAVKINLSGGYSDYTLSGDNVVEANSGLSGYNAQASILLSAKLGSIVSLGIGPRIKYEDMSSDIPYTYMTQKTSYTTIQAGGEFVVDLKFKSFWGISLLGFGTVGVQDQQKIMVVDGSPYYSDQTLTPSVSNSNQFGMGLVNYFKINNTFGFGCEFDYFFGQYKYSAYTVSSNTNPIVISSDTRSYNGFIINFLISFSFAEGGSRRGGGGGGGSVEMDTGPNLFMQN